MNDIYTRIEDYLDNALGDAERTAFEAETRADPALAEAVALTREARERLARQWAQEGAETELSKTLTTLGRQHFGAGARKPTLTRRVWWWAAAAAAIALVVWFAWPPGTEDLYDRYRRFPAAAFALKSGEPVAQNLDAAAKSFNDKDFAQALAALNAHLDTAPDDMEARFFAGLCQLELGQFSAAETSFQQMLSTKNAWSGEARWYLALAYLREKKKEECKDILSQIPPDAAHYAEAQALLNTLR